MYLQDHFRANMKKLKLALIQADLIWEDVPANREKFRSFIEKLEEGTDLVVLPEMFTSGFTMCPERVAEPVRRSDLSPMGTMCMEWGRFYANFLICQRGPREDFRVKANRRTGPLPVRRSDTTPNGDDVCGVGPILRQFPHLSKRHKRRFPASCVIFLAIDALSQEIISRV